MSVSWNNWYIILNRTINNVVYIFLQCITKHRILHQCLRIVCRGQCSFFFFFLNYQHTSSNYQTLHGLDQCVAKMEYFEFLSKPQMYSNITYISSINVN